MSSQNPEPWNIYETRSEVTRLIELAASALDIASRCTDLREQVIHMAHARAIIDALADEIIPVQGTGLQRSFNTGYAEGKGMVGVVVPVAQEPTHLPVASAYCGLVTPDNTEISGHGYERQLVQFIQPEADRAWVQNDNDIQWSCDDGSFTVAAVAVFEHSWPVEGEEPITVVMLEHKMETHSGFAMHMNPGDLRLMSSATARLLP